MSWFSGRSDLQDMKIICDVVADIASFVQPEITQYGGNLRVLRFWITPGVIGVMTKSSNRWFLKEVDLDESGEPAAWQVSPEPIALSEPGESARQVAMTAVYYLTSRWSATLEDQELPDPQGREFAQRALSAVTQRMEGGPPRA